MHAFNQNVTIKSKNARFKIEMHVLKSKCTFSIKMHVFNQNARFKIKMNVFKSYMFKTQEHDVVNTTNEKEVVTHW